MEVKFLGLDSSFVELSVSKVIEDFTSNDVLDLSSKLLLSPSSRFNRTLQAALYIECNKRKINLKLGEILTPGLLPKKINLLKSELATSLEEELALYSVILDCEKEEVDKFLGKNLSNSGLYNYSREFRKFFQELSRSFIEFGDILSNQEIELTENEIERLKFFSSIKKAFYSKLESLGQSSSDAYLNQLIIDGKLEKESDIILFNCIDLTPRIQKIISLSGVSVTHYLYARKEDSKGFTSAGNFISNYWVNYDLDIKEDIITLVDSTDLQAKILTSELKKCSVKSSVVYRDSLSAKILSNKLGESNIKHTLAVSENLTESLIGSLLISLRDYLSKKSFENFIALVKHPVIFNYLKRDLGDLTQSSLIESLLNYQSKTFQDSYNLFLQKLPASLVEVIKKVNSLIDNYFSSNDLKSLANSFFKFIEEVFSKNVKNSSFSKLNEKAFEVVVNQILSIKNLSDDYSSLEFDFSKFCTIVLNSLSAETYYSELESEEVKIVGSLEAVLDDSSTVYFLDAVEGQLPEKVNNNWFLPNSVRKILNLNDNENRFAREIYFCSVIHETKDRVSYFVPKFSPIEREEYIPSQIFYQLSKDKLIPVVKKLYKQDSVNPDSAEDVNDNLALFEVAVPNVNDNVSEMSITSFKTYLYCPYRFYLRHVEKLDTPNTKYEELSPINFGIIIHDILESFAKSDVKDSKSRDEIFNFLKVSLDNYFKLNFGSNAISSLDLQKIVIEKRLKNFSSFQAKQRELGYKILHSEYDLSALDIYLDHEHGLTKLKGRIDRIDVNEKEGKLALYDYKTSNNANKPSATHVYKGEWVDLQLPLYNYMLRAKGEVRDIEVGFINLSAENTDYLLSKAKWSDEELEEAIEVARRVAADVYSCKFWPPTENYSGDVVDFMLSSGVISE